MTQSPSFLLVALLSMGLSACAGDSLESPADFRGDDVGPRDGAPTVDQLTPPDAVFGDVSREDGGAGDAMLPSPDTGPIGERDCLAPDGTTIVHGASMDYYLRPRVSQSQDCAAIRESRSCTDGVLSGSYLYESCSTSPVSYHVDSNSGDDNNTGTAANAAWKSLTRLRRAETIFFGGDEILLRKGSKWRETLLLDGNNTRGSAASAITVSSYGSGDPPLIDASEAINSNSWTHRPNLTSKGKPIVALTNKQVYSVSISSDATEPIHNAPRQLFVNGQRMGQARFPNSGYVLASEDSPPLALDSNDAPIYATTYSIYSAEAGPEMDTLLSYGVGSDTDIFMRVRPWYVIKTKVAGYVWGDPDAEIQVENPSDYLWDRGYFHKPQFRPWPGHLLYAGFGFFFRNYLPGMETPGEWVYLADQRMLYYHARSATEVSQASIEVTQRDYCVRASFDGALVLDGIATRRARVADISLAGTGPTEVRQCSSTDSNTNGILTTRKGTVAIDDNSVKGCNATALAVYNPTSGTVNGNTLANAGYAATQEQVGLGGGGMKVSVGGDVAIERNTINNVGNNAILLGELTGEVYVRYNIVDLFCARMNDCGAVHVNGQKMTTSKLSISVNHLRRGIPDASGLPPNLYNSYTNQMAPGIYLDHAMGGASLWANTIEDARGWPGGIFVNGGWGNAINANVIYQARHHPAIRISNAIANNACTTNPANTLNNNLLYTPRLPLVEASCGQSASLTIPASSSPELLDNPTASPQTKSTTRSCYGDMLAVTGGDVALEAYRSTIAWNCR